MNTTISKYRLSSSAFNRQDEVDKVLPKRVIFLSVEGSNTEVDYFNRLNSYMENSLIRIEVLSRSRKSGMSDPNKVIELVEEYLAIREGELIPDQVIETLVTKYSKDLLTLYLEEPEKVDGAYKKLIKGDLLLAGIDLEYRQYLKKYGGENDIYAVVLDRDCKSHSLEMMERCIEKCCEKNIECYVSNPCFEFWLLLHLCDVKKEFSKEDLDKMLLNEKVSNAHTFISKEVSERAKHAKNINHNKFGEMYYPNINAAINNAKQFEQEFPGLINRLGTNIPKLIEKMDIITEAE